MNKIHLDLSARRIFLKNREQTLASYPVAVGKPSTPTPTGDFQILNKIKNPGGVLGTRWMQFTWSNHGIHGTNQPGLIGKAVSLGCVRMYNRDVEQLYEKVNVGTSVIIRNSLFTGTQEQETKNYNQSNFIYTVRRGDSLWKIARRYNTSIAVIKSINNLQGNTIYPGQKLKIPVY